MKNFVYNSRLLFLLVFSSCGTQYTSNKLILDAEKLMASNPDSALRLLSSIPHPEKLPQADYAAWCLHYTHAQYKCYQAIHSDSLINIALKYYEGGKLNKYSGTAFYLSGCVAELLHDNNKALVAYKNAIHLLRDTEEYDILGLAALNIGYVYQDERLMHKAKPYLQLALSSFLQSGNKRYLMYAYQQISELYLKLSYPEDSVFYYSDKTIQLAGSMNELNTYYSNTAFQGELLIDKNPREATNKLLSGYKYIRQNRTLYAAYLAYTYTLLNQPDSVAFFIKIAETEKKDKPTCKRLHLSKIYLDINNKQYKRAYEHLMCAYLYNDSLLNERLQSQLYHIDKQFDYTAKERENAQLKILNRNWVIAIGILIMTILIMLLVILLATIRNRKIETAHKIEQQEFKYELEKRQIELENKKALLLSKLKQKIDITLQFLRFEQNGAKTFEKEHLMDIINNHVILKESEWSYYISETDGIFGNKLTTMQNTYRELMPFDMIVIVLICLGIDIPDSCSLLNTNKNNMYIRRKRIKKRLGIDPEADLVKWLNEYVRNP